MDKFELLFKFNIFFLNVVLIFFRLKRYTFNLKTKRELKKNKFLYQIERKKRCYILGLGPSLIKENLESLNGDIIVVNRFYKIKEANKINVKYYVITDNEFYIGNAFNELKEAITFFPKAVFIFNNKYKEIIKKEYGEQSRFYFIENCNSVLPDKRKLRVEKPLPISLNCVCTALFIALALQYPEIILLGCDFNSFAKSEMAHCYDEKNKKRIWKLYYELFCYSFVSKVHDKINEYALYNNLKIINKTPMSLLDSYPKIGDKIC